MKKGSPKNQPDQFDEHNSPTEPLPAISAMLFPSPDQHGPLAEDRTVPATFSPQAAPSHFPPAYPYTAAHDIDRYQYQYIPANASSPPGTQYGIASPDATWKAGYAEPQYTRRKTFLPICVGLFFVCIQLLLVVRFAVRLLNLPVDITWVGIVTEISEIFVLPFRLLWFQVPAVSTLFFAKIEVYTLIAVLIYGVFSRLIVHILKVILNSR